MPRLRHLKNFNFNPNDFVVREPIFDGGEEFNTPDGEHVSTCGSQFDSNSAEGFSPSGEHWLSNNRVVGSLAEDEIETAIKYHEVQISLLREELDARASGLRQRELFPNWEPLARGERLKRERTPKAHSASRSTKPKLSKTDKVLRSLLRLEIPLAKLEVLLQSNLLLQKKFGEKHGDSR